MRKTLAADGGHVVVEDVSQAEFQRVDVQLRREIVEQHLLRHGGLRHAESAERTGRGIVGIDALGTGAVVGDAVRPAGVDRHPGRHGRPPARIGTGVEDAVEGHA